jgi:hypothetical protein
MDETKRMHKGFKIFILIFSVSILLLIKLDKQNIISDIFNNDNSIESVLKKKETYNDTNLIYFNSRIIKWEDNVITYLKEDGSNNWVKEFDLIEPGFILGKGNLYIIDKSSGDIFQLDMHGDTVLRLQLNKPIYNLKESNGNIIIHSKGNNEESLEFLNMEGKKISSLSTEEKILTYSVQDNGTNYIYSTIELRKSNLNSRIYVNSIENKNKYMVDFQGEIVIYTEFIQNAVVVLTDSGVYYIDNTGEIKWSRELNLIKDFHILNDRLYMLYENSFEIIDLKGKSISKISFDAEYKKVLTIDNYTVLYSNNELVILQEGKEVLKYTTEEIIQNIFIDETNIIISFVDRLEVYGFN